MSGRRSTVAVRPYGRGGVIGVLADALRQRHRGSDGFVLSAVLTALLVSSLLVTAMLGLTFATTGLAGDQVRRDRETRAAEGAVESTVARLARDANAVDGSLADAELCGWTGANPALQPSVVVPVNGIDVDVTCEAEQPEVYAPLNPNGDLVSVVGDYRGAEPRPPVITGTSPDQINARSWRTVLGSGQDCRITTDGCFPWREAVERGDLDANAASSSLNSLQSQLISPVRRVGIVHTGADPLRIIGDTQVKEGIAVLRNERIGNASATGAYDPVAPGLNVSGTFAQGAQGWLGSAADQCGLLVAKEVTAPPRPFQLPGSQVLAQEGINCAASGAANQSAVGAKLPVRKVWSPATVQAEAPAVPLNASNAEVPWSALCPPGAPLANRLIRLQPGAYTKNLTLTLNRWFTTCSGYVFHFQPGDYWFDVDEGSNAFRRNSLVMNNASNYFVFGVANGWSTYQQAQNAPMPLCRTDQAGVTITLSARTSIIHRAGTANICGVPPNTPTTQPFSTIWQEPAPDLGVSGGSTAVQGGTQSSGFFAPFGIRFIDAALNFFGVSTAFDNPITQVNVPFTTGANCIVGCTGRVTFAARFAPNAGTTVPDAAVNSAIVTVNGDSSGANSDNSSTRIDVFTKSRPNNVACSMRYPRIPDGRDGAGAVTMAYDLLDPTVEPGTPNVPVCAGVITSRKDLLESVVVVTYQVQSVGFGNYSVSVNSMNLQTGWFPRPVGQITCTVTGEASNTCGGNGSTLVNPVPVAAGVLDPGGSTTEVRLNRECTRIRIWPFPAFCIFVNTPGVETASFALRNLDDRFNPDLAYAPAATLTSAGVLVQGDSRCNFNLVLFAVPTNCDPANDVANAGGSEVRVRLQQAGVTQCEARYKRLPDFNETRYLDLLAPVGGSVSANSCRAFLTGKRNADLVGRDLVVDFILKKRTFFSSSLWSGNLCVDPACNWWGYEVNRISLTTTSASSTPAEAFIGPRTPMRVTSNNSPLSTLNGAPNPNAPFNARFTMYGPLSLPGNDLDVRWSGPASPLPVISGFPINGDNQIRTLSVRGIGSDTKPDVATTTPTTGILCCAPAKAGERVVNLRAYVGRIPGQPVDSSQLRAVARVRIVDQVPLPEPADPPVPAGQPQPGTFLPASRIIVEEWRVCTRGGTDDSCRVS